MNKSDITLFLAEHNIGFHLAKDDQVYGHLTLKRGALIHGLVDGNVNCASGSVIISESGCVVGSITAERIYIEGQIKSRQNEPRSSVVGTEMIAVSSTAAVEADLISKAFSVHSTDIRGSFHTLA